MRNKNIIKIINQQSQSGFSLIELLMVISAVALLISALVFSLVTTRINSRNARRAVDLAQLQKGIELYKLKNQADYPSGGSVPSSNTAYPVQNLASFLVPESMTIIPSDPKLPAGLDYEYAWGDNGRMYAIKIYMSNEVGGDDCVYRSVNQDGPTNNLFPGFPDCNFEEN